jgi:mannose-6-phosphate isomerase-like protein (cupin superfamily)
MTYLVLFQGNIFPLLKRINKIGEEGWNRGNSCSQFKRDADLIDKLHEYKLIAELDQYQLKLVKAKRKFILHAHEETDELFFVIDGHMQMEIEGNIFSVDPGELIVVPKGKTHRPICDEVCTVMLMEPRGTLNTGIEKMLNRI